MVVHNYSMSLYTKQFAYIPFFVLYFTRQFNCSLCCLGVGATSGEWKTKYKGLLIYLLLEVSKLTWLFLPS